MPTEITSPVSCDAREGELSGLTDHGKTKVWEHIIEHIGQRSAKGVPTFMVLLATTPVGLAHSRTL